MNMTPTRRSFLGAILMCSGLCGLLALRSAAAGTIAGTGSVSGKVTAPKPFLAAEVHLMNRDKNILFMVYTHNGDYEAINLFPGNYEVSVVKRGFAADPKKIILKAGEGTSLDFTLREVSSKVGQPGNSMGSQEQGEQTQLVPFDELYPPAPARELLQKICIYCHGAGFLPSRKWTKASAKAAIEMMSSADEKSLRATMIPPGTLTAQDRDLIAEYLATNFGPDKPRRDLLVDAEFPLDEAALAKAMYVEYYLPLDPKLDANNSQRRGQDPYFDMDGNIWYTDRSIPNRVGRLDPRTGAFKDYVLPDPKADPHGLVVDAQGQVFWAEVQGFHLGRLDPKTGEMTRYSMDSSGENKGRGHTPIVDSKQNIWYTVIAGDMIGKWDRKTQKTKVWKVPTPGASPYGIVLDKDENVWVAEFRRCKVAKFDPRTEKFTEYESPSAPCLIRRLTVGPDGFIWYGVFSGGKIGKLDPATGKITEYEVPMPFSEPYDIWPDHEGYLWVSDGGQGGALIRFDPHTAKFTYYPTPQITDQPKVQITRENAIWYNPRSSSKGAVGVLYPDVTKMTTFAAYE
jgi:virginiamycin B lyase